MTQIGLDIGLKALLTSRSALDVVGQNIANASTPGYSRQSLETSADRHLSLRGLILGGGVRADVVRRVSDALLSKRLLQETSSLARFTSLRDSLSRVEGLFGEPGSGGIETSLQQLFSAISSLSGAPADPSLRASVVQGAGDVAHEFRGLHTELESLFGETAVRAGALAGEVTALGERIHQLNVEIVKSEAGRVAANDLRDKRDLALRELSALVDIQTAEEPSGAARVLISGQMFVGSTLVNAMTVEKGAAGALEIHLEGLDGPVSVHGGALGGLVGFSAETLPGISGELDELARAFIFEMNRAHSTGIPSGGPFQYLVSQYAARDQDGDGQQADELLARSGLPFAMSRGELFVNITDRQTGQVTRHEIAVDPASMTVGDLASALEAVPHLTAWIDSQGRMQMSAESGFGFDFSRRLLTDPDSAGSFGGGRASLASAQSGPFALSHGDTLGITTGAGSFTITFDAADFQLISQATAAEIAAAINADPSAQANGVVASAVGDELMLQTAGSGSSQSFQLSGGTALGAFGWTAGANVVGSDKAVAVQLSGAYTGASNERYTFRANMDGSVGVTPGLQVLVFDGSGSQVAALDVGSGYQPGTELDIAGGIRASFHLGDLSATDHDVLAIDALANSDTAGVLPALGINSLFEGSGAGDIALREDIERNPALLATSSTGTPGDGTVLLDLLGLSERGAASLSGMTFSERLGEITSEVGRETSTANSSAEARALMLAGLEERQAELSGVNLDEELVLLMEYEQAFAAASQYIRVISELTQELVSLV